MVLASEAGVLAIPEERIVKKWRLPPGKRFLIVKFFLIPMAVSGQEPVGAMGRDNPQAVLSRRPKSLFDSTIKFFVLDFTNFPYINGLTS